MRDRLCVHIPYEINYKEGNAKIGKKRRNDKKEKERNAKNEGKRKEMLKSISERCFC